MPVYDADADKIGGCTVDPWEAAGMTPWDYARTISIEELYRYSGQIIKWPPSDADLIWWGKLITKLHQYKQRLAGNKKSNTNVWNEKHDIYGRFGEAKFGLEFGLLPYLVAWPGDLSHDFKVIIGGKEYTIDIKASGVQVAQKYVYLNLTLDEIQYKKDNGIPFCDIYVAAWVPDELQIERTFLLGWAHKSEMLGADVQYWKSYYGSFADARGIASGNLRKMEDLYKAIYPPASAPPAPPKPHWSPVEKKGQQDLFSLLSPS
jgi:hypothetical protein